MSTMERDQNDNRIAIIGMACRFPGAPDLASFWANLCAGKESIEALSDDVLKAAGVPSRDINSPDYVKVASVIEDADRFDASFFYLSAREAEKMDPQLRVFLEGAMSALEGVAHGMMAVGFEVPIRKLEGYFKLHQRNALQDADSQAHALRQRGNDTAAALADLIDAHNRHRRE